MRSSLITLLFFLLGGVVGACASVSVDTHRASVYVLYLLMLLLGISLGCSRDPKQIVASLRPDALLLPLATVGGTLLFSAMGGFLLSRWTAFDCMAVGSGFAYYSVSSILITEIKSASLGVQVATELGTIALLSNIVREMIALLGAALLVRLFGTLAPIAAAGATAMDTTLPVISRTCGPRLVPVSIYCGMATDFSVPFLVTLFCSM